MSLVSDAVLGDRLRWSALTVIVGLALSRAMGALLSRFVVDTTSPTLSPTGVPGAFLAIGVPLFVGYCYRQNRGLLPTLLVCFPPVLEVQRAVREHAHTVGAFADPGTQQLVLVPATYWLTGIVLAVAYDVVRS